MAEEEPGRVLLRSEAEITGGWVHPPGVEAHAEFHAARLATRR